MEGKKVQLRVGEIPSNAQSDIGIGIVRIDTNIMRALNIREGDAVQIEGKKKTGAIAIRPYPKDIGINIIRMDGYTRRNAGTGIGEQVTVVVADIGEATKITLAPADPAVQPLQPDVIQIIQRLLQRRLLGRIVTQGDIIVPPMGSIQRQQPFREFFGFEGEDIGNFGFEEIGFDVVSTAPAQMCKITNQTEIKVLSKATKRPEEQAGVPAVTYEDIGGLKEVIIKLRDMIELPLKHPELFKKLGIDPPKGVILYGPPGTGKTLIARAVASESGANFYSIAGPEVMSKFYGESEENVRKIFKEAEENAPSIIFIDEIDSLAPKREKSGEVERRVVAQLLSLMDGLKSRGQVIVIAATNMINTIDPALRRGGRFDREIEIGVPTREGRLEIFRIHARNMPLYNWDEGAVKSVLKDRIDAFESKAQKETQDNAKNDAEKIKHDVKTVNKIKDDIKKDPKLLGKLVFEITKIEHSINLSEVAEIELESKIKGIVNKEIYPVLKNLIDAQIVTLTGDFREEITKKSADKMMDSIADITYGYVGADISALCKEAAMIALRRILPDINLKDETIDPKVLEKIKVTEQDFRNALLVVEPSAMREIMVEVPKVKWEEVGGLKDAKQALVEMVEWPIKNPEAFKRMGIRPPRGILLYGLPGTGKTLLARAIAGRSESNFIAIKGPEIFDKYVGESEKAIRELFKRAKQVAPSIVFIDEIDSIAPRRGHSMDSNVTDRVVNQLLTEMDGLESLEGVVVIAATNRPDILDPGVLRAGRFDRHLYVPVPDKDSRKSIFDIYLKRMPLKDVDIDELVEKTEYYVGADIESICREAAINALRKNINAEKVTMDDFYKALDKVKPTVTKKDIESYDKKVKESKISKEEDLSYFG